MAEPGINCTVGRKFSSPTIRRHHIKSLYGLAHKGGGDVKLGSNERRRRRSQPSNLPIDMVIRHARVDGDFAVVAKTSKSFTSEVQRIMADLFAVGGVGSMAPGGLCAAGPKVIGAADEPRGRGPA